MSIISNHDRDGAELFALLEGQYTPIPSPKAEPWGDHMVWLIKTDAMPRLLLMDKEPEAMGPMEGAIKLLWDKAQELLGPGCRAAWSKTGIVCLIGLSCEDNSNAMLDRHIDIARQLVTFGAQDCSLDVKIYMGRPLPGPEGCIESYRDAENMCSYCRLIQSDKDIVRYLDFEQMQISEARTLNWIKLLKSYASHLERRDFRAAREVMDRLIDFEFVGSAPAVDAVRLKTEGLMYLIVSSLEPAIAQRSIRLSLPRLRELETGSDAGLTIEGLHRLIAQVFDLAEQSERESESERLPKWVPLMMKHIDENLGDPMLSVGSLAETFGITPAYVSRVMKDYLKIGLLEYIQRRRVGRAVSMLGSDRTLTEIAALCGFFDLRSMRRAFMRHEGMTPRELQMEKKA